MKLLIITTKRLEKKKEDIDTFLRLLKSIHLNEAHLKNLNKIISNPQFQKKAKKIISNCMVEYYKAENSERKINNLPDYTYTALKRFNDGAKLY